ncbi:hypothetical protein EUTSA_v10003097mg, partial [Eutrema salsugineum]
RLSIFNQVEIATIYHCDGLFLCVTNEEITRLVVWSPYSGETRWIQTRKSFRRHDKFAFGYENNNRNHKFLFGLRLKFETNSVSWSKFLKVDKRLLTRFPDGFITGVLFIDEEKKVIVVYSVRRHTPTNTCSYEKAYIIGEDGYFKSVSIGDAQKPDRFGNYSQPKFTSYVPSLVQLKGEREKEIIN